MVEYHSIPVRVDTAERLAEEKSLGDSWDDVVRQQAFNENPSERNV
jgi:hypothetical protein